MTTSLRVILAALCSTASAYAAPAGQTLYEGDPAPLPLILSEDTVGNAYRRILDEIPTEPRDISVILANLQTPVKTVPYNRITGPWIFSGYRPLSSRRFEPAPLRRDDSNWPWGTQAPDSVAEPEIMTEFLESLVPQHNDSTTAAAPTTSAEELTILRDDATPDWLRSVLTQDRIASEFIYSVMVDAPWTIDYAYWNLPEPPRLPEDDVSFSSYLRKLNIDVKGQDKLMPTFTHGATHWLHTFRTGAQFSQAYISSNWYQGGNNNISLLLNLNWDVALNTVYHPDLLLQSALAYKLGLNSTEKGSLHPYSISEDLLQWNFKAGYKAFKNFFWSYTLQFKTQLFNNYPVNSNTRSASFLSPGDLNMGLGMSYSYQSKPKRVKFGLSLSPISYNLKTCIDHVLDPTKFNIDAGHKTHNEIGSNLEANLEWGITPDISCRSRLFAFTDYHYTQGDLETTFNFAINRFLSSQIYLHLRYDSSIDESVSRWRKWMLKEILSFGLTYTFTTKPPTK